MVKEAEAHAEDDRQFRELVEVRNRADHTVHEARKQLESLGDAVDGGLRGEVESAISTLEDTLQSDDQDVITTKTQALAELIGKLAEAQAAQATNDERPAGKPNGKATDDSVVDADFEDVTDERKTGS